jgi:DHA3 family macrolide efflux protein-like MFS transporter
MTANASIATQSNWKAPFFTIWTGQAFSLLGSQLVGFALVWWITVTTGSAKVLALAAMMEWLPRVFVGPLAGTLVDRWNRRAIMLVADSLTALATVALIYLGWTGLMQPWHVYVLMLMRAIGGAFHWPAMQASTSLMVPTEQLSRVQGLNQLLTALMNIVAPPLGGLLVGLIPLHAVLAIDIGTAILAILPLCFISIPQPRFSEEETFAENKKSSVWQDMWEGLRYVWGWPGLRASLTVAILLNLLAMPGFSLLPLLVTKHFGGDAMEIASMQSSWAIGMLVGGVLLSVWGGFRRKVLTSVLGMLGSGIGLLLVGFSPGTAFGIALVGNLVAGSMNVLMNGPAFALLQAVVDEDMQGRVLALVLSLANAATPLGLAIAGPLADVVGVRVWFVLAGAGFMLGGVFAYANPAIRTVEERRTRAQSTRLAAPSTTGAEASL